MLDRFIYENHLGQRFDSLANGVFLNYSTLRDYSWSHESINDRISRFYRPVINKKMPVVIVGKTEAEAMLAQNTLLDIAEVDIAAVKPGKLYINGYYTHGWITGSTKSDYLISKRYTKNTLTFVSDGSAWYKETTHVFAAGLDAGINNGSGTDYPYDYQYDYALKASGRIITCDGVGNNAFKLRIYGLATSPAVSVNGHQYKINGTINPGESLLIDSVNRTITLTTASGTPVNWFDKRDRQMYIFEPIKPGMNTITWVGTFGFDLMVIEERSEPKWT